MPQEATEALKKVLKEYYMQDSTPIAVALWRAFAECHYVTRDENTKDAGVLWFHTVGEETKKKSS